MTTLPEAGSSGISRRRFLQLSAAASALAVVLPELTPTRARAADTAADPLADDAVAQTYHRVLLKHTRWVETQWDAKAGHYLATDFSFAVVLGNALLLTRGAYDAGLAGVDAQTLKDHTLATLSHFAASNRLLGGTEWGETLFFDTTFQLYFQLAGRLLWDDLDQQTRDNLDQIARRQAAYTTALGSGDDPRSGSWTPNGLQGGWVGDTKLEEMGVYAQSIAPALAWAPHDTDADDWRSWFGKWSRNETGLPAADLVNPTVVDGVPVSANTAHNLYDTFLVENHGSFEPHYQCELWRTSARNGIHFISAGVPMPEVLAEQPNGTRLWRTILAVMSDAGEPLMPMLNDREHLYGRDVIPIAFLAQVLGDRSAAWAESALAERLEAYQDYPPQYRITKFSGEPKYEPEARAEVAISYLLHEWRARTAGPVVPLDRDAVFADAAGVIDFGSGPGLVTHQTRASWAAAVSKPGFVKFAWQPGHDDWLFKLSNATPMFLPNTHASVRSRSVTPYRELTDGFEASATVLGLDTGRAGFATLPGGSVVYATTGVGVGEGHLEVFNLTMPGVPGLDGDRTYTAADGTATVASADSGSGTVPPGVTRVDTLTFDTVTTRWVRMLGVRPDPTYGYSIFEFEVHAGSGPNLAVGRPTTASSADPAHVAKYATDANMTTRWAVSRGDRPRADSWLAVDLGAPAAIDRAVVYWEAAAGRGYDIQVSDDGSSWRTVASYPRPDLTTTGGWLDVDGRAGLVVRDAANPITVTGDVVTLSDGPAAPLLVEAYPGADAATTAARHADPAPTTSEPTVRASTAEGYLSLFNLGTADTSATVALTQDTSRVAIYPGTQRVTATGTELTAQLTAASAAVLPVRFVLLPIGAPSLPVGLQAEVVDGSTVRLRGPACQVRVGSPATAQYAVVTVGATPQKVVLSQAPAYPFTDLALGRVTFPTSPLPPGMSDPAAAVDGDANTAWIPGESGRMVVDLGAARAISRVGFDWVGDRGVPVDVATSTDGTSYSDPVRVTARQTSTALTATARYVSVQVIDWPVGGPRMRTLSVS